MAQQPNLHDADEGKGAVEGDGRERTEAGRNGNTSMAGQNPHRERSRLVKSNDSDFPEPGGSPEHSGQKVEGDERQPGEQINQDPGDQQKPKQDGDKDDPLAA